MIAQCLFFLSISAGCVFGLVSEKYRYERMLPITCMSIVWVLFLFGLVDHLRAGLYVVWTMCALLYIAFVAGAIYFWKKYGMKSLFLRLSKTVLSPGMFVFLAFFLMTMYINNARMLSVWDEFSHWGTVVKQMCIADVLSTSPKATAVSFKSYPPAMALFQYYLQKIYLTVSSGRQFSEWRLYFSYQIFAFAMLMPFIGKLEFKRPYAYVMCAVVWLSSLLVFSEAYSSIYVDFFLGLVSGAGLATVYTKDTLDGIDSLQVLLSATMLVLIKDVGILLAIFLVAGYVVTKFTEKQGKRSPRNITGGRSIWPLFAGIIAVALPKVLWRISISANDASVAFPNRIDFESLMDVIMGREGSYRRAVLRNYIKAIFDASRVSFLDTAIPFLLFLVVLALFAYFVYRIYRRQYPQNTKRYKILFWMMIAETVIYLTGLCVIYMYQFEPGEAKDLASFNRYTGIILNSMWFFFLCSITGAFKLYRGDRSVLAAILLCGILATVDLTSVLELINRRQVANTIEQRYPYEPLSEKLLELTEEDSRIYLVVQESDGYEYWVMKFLLMPRNLTLAENFSWSIGTPFFKGDIWTHHITVDELQHGLADSYDYVALFRINDYFCNEYRSIFEDVTEITENSVYAVNHETGMLTRVD